MARGFARTTGLEYDDLAQEAKIAYWKAENDPRYDPHKAGVATFCSMCTHRTLCNYTARQQTYATHHQIEPIDPAIPDDRVPPDDAVYFRELLGALPDDAKTIVGLMFGEAARVSTGNMREFVRKRLYRVWPRWRIDQAFRAIAQMLRTA